MNDTASSADRTRKFNKAIGSYDIDTLQNLEAGNEQENKNYFRPKTKVTINYHLEETNNGKAH